MNAPDASAARPNPSLSQTLRALEDQHLLAWHHQPRIVFKEGRGVQLWDVDGRQFLDFASGHINLPKPTPQAHGEPERSTLNSPHPVPHTA